MRKRSLVYRLTITFTAILTVIVVSIDIVLSCWFRGFFLSQKKETLDRQSKLIESAAISHINSERESSLEALKDTIDFVSDSIDADILITDNLGITYAVSNKEHEGIKLTSIDITDKDMKSLKKGETVQYSGTTKFGANTHTYLKPIISGDYFGGIIVIVTSTESLQNILLHVYKIVWLLLLVEIVLACGIIYYFIKKMLVNPLDKLSSAANKLAKGDVRQRLEITSDDEIGDLSASFNIMAESLEKVETNRRDFISNVSHELRSPITSMKGFIAGILDGVIPRDRENYYLNIVYDEINRLSRLVEDLLDISSLDEGKFKLNKIEIDINVLIRICLANLEGRVQKKNLKVDVIFDNAHQFVFADRDRMIQVITNLLDNSIKYTDINGYIKIETKVRNNKVYVSIFNNGQLISEEGLARIWDRFYKSDKSRTNKESTGLGLPIVRLILTQHGEEIWVRNEKDGVRFTFTLTTI